MDRRPRFVALLLLSTACAPAQGVTVASLAGSRQLVTVSFPTQQTLRATAGARDTVLEGVSDVVGWPTAARGDTLHLQVARWRAAGRMHTMDPPDRVIAVAPDAAATIRRGEHSGGGYSLVVLGAIVVMSGVALALWWVSGEFGN